MERKELKGAIFDLDGLLLDTEKLYEQAISEVLAQYNKTYPAELRSQVIGKSEMLGGNLITSTLELPLSAEEFLRARDAILHTLFPKAEACRGAKELCQYFVRNKVPIAVATSSKSSGVEIKIGHLKEGWFEDIKIIITGNDERIKAGKPAPDIFILAAQELGLDPKHCVVFEDSPSGCEAGRKSGAFVVAVPSIPNRNDLYQDNADLILNSLLEFTPTLYGFPPDQEQK